MDQLTRDYEGQAHSLFVYTREAHPEKYPEFPAIRSIEQKFDHARIMKERHQTPRTVLTDGVDGAVHRAWSGCSNMSWVIDHTGRVHFKSNWTHEPDLRAALDSAVKMRELKREGSANQYFTEGVWYAREHGEAGTFEKELERERTATARRATP